MITAYVMEDNNAIVPENELHSGPASIKVYSYIILIYINNYLNVVIIVTVRMQDKILSF